MSPELEILSRFLAQPLSACHVESVQGADRDGKGPARQGDDQRGNGQQVKIPQEMGELGILPSGFDVGDSPREPYPVERSERLDFRDA